MKNLIKSLPILFLITTIGCQEQDDLAPINSWNVEDARQWFQNNYSDNFTVKLAISESNVPINIPFIAVWEDAYQASNNELFIVEVDLKTKVNYGLFSEESKSKWIETGDSRYITSTPRLIIIKSKKSGYIKPCIMTIKGDSDYLQETNFDMSPNRFLSKDERFSGLFLFHDMEGKFNNGWKIDKGSAVGYFGPKSLFTNTQLDRGRTNEQVETCYFTSGDNNLYLPSDVDWEYITMICVSFVAPDAAPIDYWLVYDDDSETAPKPVPWNISQNELCDNISFIVSYSENKMITNIQGLGLALTHSDGRQINVGLNESCVKIGNVFSSSMASTIFTNAFREATIEVKDLLNSNTLKGTTSVVKNKLIEVLQSKLSGPNASFSTQSCSDNNAPSNVASFGC